jgi:hypothetical protein
MTRRARLRYFSSLPYHPSNPRACSLGRRRTLLPPRPLPVNSPHLGLPSSCRFPATRNRNHTRNHLRKNDGRSTSAHGLHMLPHPESCHRHFFEMLTHSPQVPPRPVNCSSLEVMYTHPGIQVMNYICSQRRISPQVSCRPAETFPAHVSDIVPCSLATLF